MAGWDFQINRSVVTNAAGGATYRLRAATTDEAASAVSGGIPVSSADVVGGLPQTVPIGFSVGDTQKIVHHDIVSNTTPGQGTRVVVFELVGVAPQGSVIDTPIAFGWITEDDVATVAPVAFDNFTAYNNGTLGGQGAWVDRSGNASFKPTVVTDTGVKYVDMQPFQVPASVYNTAKQVPANEAKYAVKARWANNAGVAFGFGYTDSRTGLIAETFVSDGTFRINSRISAYNTSTSQFENLGTISAQLTEAQVNAELQIVVQVSGGKVSLIANGVASDTQITLNATGIAAVNAAGLVHLQNCAPATNGMRYLRSVAIYAPTAPVDWNYSG